jgi:hypothetical protein
MNMNDQFNGHPVEILSMEPGSSLGEPMALVLLRPHPNENTDPFMLLFNREQCVRLRDTFHLFLSHPDSWLYMPQEEQAECVVENAA